MFTLIIENFRCFRDYHELKIKPLTILTGENSSGKTALLAAISCVAHRHFPYRLPLNETPFNFGNYRTIATNLGGSYGVAEFLK